ncbi:MAG: glycosyltransferase [Chthoniobacterales bacterium]
MLLPSFRFQPHFYSGGVSRFHLPLLYDLVTLRQPLRVVTLGYGDGQAAATLAQALAEQKRGGSCLTIRRSRPDERAEDDAVWQKALTQPAPSAGLIAGDPLILATKQPDGSIDLLLLDDCDRYETARAELQAWLPKISTDGLILFHGVALRREPLPRRAFEELFQHQPTAEFSEGIGLALVALNADRIVSEPLLRDLFGPAAAREEVAALHRSSATRIAAEQRAQMAERNNLTLALQEVWLHTVLADRWTAQEVMDEQMAEMNERARAFGELHQDRIKAQLVLDTQSEQLKQWIGKSEALSGENRKLKAQIAADKRLLNAAKKACRNRVRCFGMTPEEAKRDRRPIAARIVRELKRIPRNLQRFKAPPAPLETKAKAAPALPVDRYADWIAAHEPNEAALAAQREEEWSEPPRISLLLPTFQAPAKFLDELIASLAAQTYPHFEICVADGGSDATTRERLERWQESEPRLRLALLPQNLGIAENTNRALALATGDFFSCIDQDDLLAPSALHAVAEAIVRQPAVDIFYSDEDRLTSGGERRAPFFKPEWNPEYLLSSMYLGHLTAYRRSLTSQIGVFRKEFDLSQDYDFALRATELARAVGHIPQVLYHWREHPASASAGGKPQARVSNLAALDAALERRGLDAEIVEYPSANRARLTIADWPRVSIIIPTDSPERARACLKQLPLTTVYPDWEIILVTNSALADSLKSLGSHGRIVRYDGAFNFSEKSNLGARSASGSRLIFFNDDVESGQPDWIQNVIEPLENPAVGAVAPKLLYPTGKIQHAGLVTGVRDLVGTACHQWPANSTDYSNFAQSMRDASALSAACLAMRRDDFFAVGEFDAVNTPIAHSDLDLCFKVRAAGMRCVYTPFATMRHTGHASIGGLEAPEEKTPRREKASVYLLRRWPGYVLHDPYFPDNLRDWLYADSPTPLRMWAPTEAQPGHGRTLLFVSHDLSWSGAPLILLEMARWCRARGFFVVLMSPNDGPLREEFVRSGVPVIADPLIAKNHPSFARLAGEFDCMVASTIFGAPMVRTAKEAGIPHLWWIHEGRIAAHYLGEDATLRLALREADLVVTPDTVSAQVYQPFREKPMRVLRYGIPDPSAGLKPVAETRSGPVKFLLLGTIEQRKGQRVLLAALRRLSPAVRSGARFTIVGRPHEIAIADEVRAAAAEIPELSCGESVTHAAALALIRATDVMLSCSFDETGPLILMEALALGRPILATTVGSVAESLTNEEGALFFPPGDATALAAAITRLVREPELLARLRSRARGTYERHFAFRRFGEEFETLVEEVMTARV